MKYSSPSGYKTSAYHVILCLFLVLHCAAEKLTLTGHVMVLSSNEPLAPNVHIRFFRHNDTTKMIYETYSDSVGKYIINNFEPGLYDIYSFTVLDRKMREWICEKWKFAVPETLSVVKDSVDFFVYKDKFSLRLYLDPWYRTPKRKEPIDDECKDGLLVQ
ncbi:carboxypeptidase-like regulatory domain-containing protein [Fibrobacterota bacterium]